MTRIDSAKNPRVLDARRALERGERVPLEGERTLREALDAGLAVEEVFAAAGTDPLLLAEALRRGASVHEVTARVLERLSDLASARGLVGLALAPSRTPDAVEPGPDGIVLLLDGVQDPANVGALLRSAEAFGAAGALLLSGCASPFSARALRASAGSALRLPVAAGVGASEAVTWARRRGALLAGADAHGGELPDPAKLRRPIVLAVGAEGRGLSDEVSSALDVRLTLPLAGRVESLNAAVAGALLLYLLARR